MSGHRREFIGWLVKTCAQDGTKPADIMDVDAIELLAERLRTALQIEMHLTLAFEHAFRLGEKRVSTEIVEQVLSRAIDELEPNSDPQRLRHSGAYRAAPGQAGRSA